MAYAGLFLSTMLRGLSLGRAALRAAPLCAVRTVPVRALSVTPMRLRQAPPEPQMELPPSGERAEKTFSRFWKKVSVGHVPASAEAEEHFTVLLDKRALRTPGGKVLTVPADRPLLACLISEEWDTQTQVLKPHSLPLTSLASRAIDGLATEKERAEVVDYLLRYFDTDSITFYEQQPKALVELQASRWDPILDWAREFFQIEINAAHGALSSAQPAASRARVADVLGALSPLELAVMERAVMTTKSIFTSFALFYRRIEAEQAALAAEVETAAQASTWGAVEDSHDVDHAELRRQLASVACAQVTTEPELVERFVEVLKQKYSA